VAWNKEKKEEKRENVGESDTKEMKEEEKKKEEKRENVYESERGLKTKEDEVGGLCV
jgi:hypothetical protein